MKLFILAGTSEGRKLAEYCEEQRLETVVSVATFYGESLVTEGEFVKIRCGRMEEAELTDYLLTGEFTHVIDATHPYATVVTANIRKACENRKINYWRLLRESEEVDERCVVVESVLEAVEYLKDTVGNVLITTGSKEIGKYTALKEVSRLYPRILPSAEQLSACEVFPIPKQNYILMQGPFSKELNKAMLQQINGRYLVTKEAGNAGGFTEKIEACLELGVLPIVVKRPTKEEGYSLEQIKEKLENFVPKTQQICIAGIGPGAEAFLTAQVKEAILAADVCIGAKRMLEPAQKCGKAVFASYTGEEIRLFLKKHQEYSNVLILMSGDIGFYSGAKKLTEELKEWKPKLMPGISSVVYLCSLLNLTWEDVKLCSRHGIESNLVDYIRENKLVFTLLGDGTDLQRISKELIDLGMDSVKIHAGMNLSYPEEQVITGVPKDFVNTKVEKLCVALFEHSAAEENRYSFGISDEEFIRGKVPMTKQEVRTVSLSKLKLTKDAVIYDIGAGTGSVSIEMSLLCTKGSIYAVEKKAEAIQLIHDNRKKFKVGNLHVVKGQAPEMLEDLPKPTHAFIGGSSGNLEEIVRVLFAKNPKVRIVINAIALETLGQVTTLARKFDCQLEIVQIAVSRGKEIGNYHMMTGENPVTIFTLWKE